MADLSEAIAACHRALERASRILRTGEPIDRYRISVGLADARCSARRMRAELLVGRWAAGC